jgi:hypothetical protein
MTQHISVSAINLSGYTESQKIVYQRIKFLGIKKIKISSQGSQTWLRAIMSSQCSQTSLRSPLSSQGSQTWLRSPLSSQCSQTWLRSPLSSQGSQTWQMSPMSSQGCQTLLRPPKLSQCSQTWLRSHRHERGDPYVWYVGRVWRYQRGGQNPSIQKGQTNNYKMTNKGQHKIVT